MATNTLLLLGATFLGLIVGSFLNAYVWRFLRDDVAITEGRSQCVHCSHQLVFFDLIPVVSYVALLGKCRYCGKAIPAYYPLVELGVALVTVVIAQHFGFSWVGGIAVLFAFFLEALFLLDLFYSILPDVLTIPAVIVGLAFGILQHIPWMSLALGAGIGAGFFALQFVVSQGAWIGSGDIRLGAAMGVALGWQQTVVALLLAYCGGALIAVVLIALRKKRWHSSLPFGVFLTAATVVTMVWGGDLLHSYMNLFLLS